jgi:hypothetical protein
MRWNNLFDDLSAQLDRELASEHADERRDTARAVVAQTSQREILKALSTDEARTVLMHTRAHKISVRVDSVGADWVAVTEIDHKTSWGSGTHVIPAHAITAIELASGGSLASETRRHVPSEMGPRLIDRVAFDVVLRDLARRRRWVEISTHDGLVAGTLDVVGRDWCEVARHPRHVARRQSAITGSVLIPLTAVFGVRVD